MASIDTYKKQDGRVGYRVRMQYKPYPWVSAVAGTHYCYVGMDVDEERHSIAVMSVLDSVGKGGARVGIENLNIIAGFKRTDSLLDRGLHP